MRKYDYQKAKKIIENYQDKGLKRAYLGMEEDWWWTSEKVWEEGRYLVNLDEENLKIADISGSTWATPILLLDFGNENYKKIKCYTGKKDRKTPPSWFTLGTISAEADKWIKNIPYAEE